MTGIFEVETKTSEWGPPFTKTNVLNQFNVNEGEKFDKCDKTKEDVFELQKVEGQTAVVKFNRQYSLKKTQFAANTDVVAPQTLKLTLGNSVEFSYMWGITGITKKITFTGVGTTNPQDFS